MKSRKLKEKAPIHSYKVKVESPSKQGPGTPGQAGSHQLCGSQSRVSMAGKNVGLARADSLCAIPR